MSKISPKDWGEIVQHLSENTDSSTRRERFGCAVSLPTVGHNSFFKFVEDKKWACIIEFPSQSSERAKFIGDLLKRSIIPKINPNDIIQDIKSKKELGALSSYFATINDQEGIAKILPDKKTSLCRRDFKGILLL